MGHGSSPLAEVDEPSQVTAAIAHGVGLYDGPERSAASALVPYLAERWMLASSTTSSTSLEAADQVAALVRASRGAGSWSRAVPRCTSSASTICRSRRWSTTPSRCSGTGRAPCVRAGSRMASSTRSARYAACSTTAARHRAGGGPRVDAPADGHPRSPGGAAAAPGSGPRDARRASGRSTAPWPGATTCSTPGSSAGPRPGRLRGRVRPGGGDGGRPGPRERR